MIPTTASNAHVAPTRESADRSRLGAIVLVVAWLALGVRLALGFVGPKLSGDLTIPGLAFFVVTAVVASRVYLRVAKPEATPESDA